LVCLAPQKNFSQETLQNGAIISVSLFLSIRKWHHPASRRRIRTFRNWVAWCWRVLKDRHGNRRRPIRRYNRGRFHDCQTDPRHRCEVIVKYYESHASIWFYREISYACGCSKSPNSTPTVRLRVHSRRFRSITQSCEMGPTCRPSSDPFDFRPPMRFCSIVCTGNLNGRPRQTLSRP
jgi:hypothetical protein